MILVYEYASQISTRQRCAPRLFGSWLRVGTKHRARGPWEMRGLRSRCGHEYMHRLCSSFVPWTTFALGSHSGSWALRTSSGKSTSLVLRPSPTASMRAGLETPLMLLTGSPSPPNDDDFVVLGSRSASLKRFWFFFWPCCDRCFCQIVVVFVRNYVVGVLDKVGDSVSKVVRIFACVLLIRVTKSGDPPFPTLEGSSHKCHPTVNDVGNPWSI